MEGRKESKIHVHNSCVVLPPGGTLPSGRMYLSSIDQHLSYYVRNLLFFNNSPGADILAEKLKDSLSKLLVPYNFYAGRLCLNEDNRLDLDCNNAGAHFRSATSHLSVQDVTSEDLDAFFLEPKNKSLDKMPLLTLQVTTMADDGYAIGVMNHHIGADAMSGTYMMMNLACIARGEEICLVPDSDRTQLMMKPGQKKLTHPEFKPAGQENRGVPRFSVTRGEDLAKLLVESESTRKNLAMTTEMERRKYSMTTRKIAALKEEAMGPTGNSNSIVKRCSTFEVLAALVWKAHSQAKFKDDMSSVVKLQYVVDVRNILDPPLGANFCGNAYYPVCTDHVCAEELIKEPLSATVGRVQRAREILCDEHVRSGWEYLEAHPEYWYQHDCTTVINSWPRLMQKVLDLNFGWGTPCRVEFPRDPRNSKVFFLPFIKDGILVTVYLNPAEFLEFERCIDLY